MKIFRVLWLSCMLSCAVFLYIFLGQGYAADLVYLPDELGQPAPLYAGSYALLIGVSDYTNGWPDLPNAVNDAREVQTALEKHGFQVTLLTNPTAQAICPNGTMTPGVVPSRSRTERVRMIWKG